MSTKHLATLNRLHRLCLLGERGFNTLAAAVRARGIKMVLKTYAQQRHEFAQQLSAEIDNLSGRISQRAGPLGTIHRGRITIFSSMTLGEDNVQRRAINEALRGERVAAKAYQRALRSDLPLSTRKLLEQQLREINETDAELKHLRGEPGRRLVVSHFSSRRAAENAQEKLNSADFSNSDIVDVEADVETYIGKGRIMRDAMISMAVGGSVWGTLMGLAAGGFLFAVPEANPMAAMGLSEVAAISLILGALFGLVLGLIFGFFIGYGVREEDENQYSDLLIEGSSLLYVQTNRRRAAEARKIMRRSKGQPTPLFPQATPAVGD